MSRLIGRHDELARLDAALAVTAGGTGGTVLVTGAAGIGKTRLVTEFSQGAAGAGFLLGRCLDLVGASVPYLAVAEAMRPLPSSPFASGSPAGRHRLSLFSDVRSALAREAETTPVVLVIEDVHWADVSTLDILSYVAAAAPELRVLLVLTARVPELAARWFDGMRRHPGTAVIELGPLDRAELGELLPESLPGSVADAVFRRSGGNPFLAQELAAAEGELPGALRGDVAASGLPPARGCRPCDPRGSRIGTSRDPHRPRWRTSAAA